MKNMKPVKEATLIARGRNKLETHGEHGGVTHWVSPSGEKHITVFIEGKSRKFKTS